MSRRVLTGLAALLMLAGTPWLFARNEEPASLFDGKTLDGWEGDKKVWRVEEGIITGGSFEGNPRNEFLATTKDYKDFTLSLQYRLITKSGTPNAGVQIRSQRITNPPNEMKGYQADIGAFGDGKPLSGSLYDESRRNKFLAASDPELLSKTEKPGEWNDMEVTCKGPRIVIKINGKQTVDYTEADASIPLEGKIGLQIHGGQKAEVYYRNIKILEDK